MTALNANLECKFPDTVMGIVGECRVPNCGIATPGTAYSAVANDVVTISSKLHTETSEFKIFLFKASLILLTLPYALG